MRTILILSMLAASLAYAAGEYRETRELSLASAGIGALEIEAGAGSMEIAGVSGLNEINVEASIVVPARNDDKAKKIVADDLVLYLEKEGDNAVLHAYFDNSGFSFDDSPAIHLAIRVPENMSLDVDDGSGSLEIEDVRGDIELDDGSGSITLNNVGGTVEIDDGSGSITARGVGGDIKIDDGSGSIKVSDVAGSVIVDDGSGSIDARDVENDLIIVNDGSGGLNFSNIGGKVEKES